MEQTKKQNIAKKAGPMLHPNKFAVSSNAVVGNWSLPTNTTAELLVDSVEGREAITMVQGDSGSGTSFQVAFLALLPPPANRHISLTSFGETPSAIATLLAVFPYSPSTVYNM